jgi:hypothetical protein
LLCSGSTITYLLRVILTMIRRRSQQDVLGVE